VSTGRSSTVEKDGACGPGRAIRPQAGAQQKGGGNKAAATIVGRVVAERAKQAGIDKVCFDRRSYKYHGRVEALANAAREAGLKF